MQRRDNGDLSKARQVLEGWRKKDAGNPEPVLRLVELDWQTGDDRAALKRVRTMQQAGLWHQHADYYLGVALQRQARNQEALAAYRAAIEANISIAVDESALVLEAAIEMYETAAGHYPGSLKQDEQQLLNAEFEYQNLAGAVHDWQAGEPVIGQLNPEQITRYSNACYNLGCRDMATCNRISEAIAWFDQALTINPAHLLALLNRLFVLNYDSRRLPEDIAREHFQAGLELRRQLGRPNGRFSNPPDPDRKLRIGYLSSDFRKHSVAFFITPVLEQHQHSRFEIYCYYNERRRDYWTDRVRAASDHFRPVAGLDSQVLLNQISQDGIDILVDLNGYTKGHRVDVVGRRAAPLQVSWIGYPNTTGLDVMDYRIVDLLTDPESQDPLTSETLIRMPSCFSVYAPPAGIPEPAAELPARRRGYFTFGSFNFISKLNPDLLAVWGEILRQVPESKLLIKNIMLSQPVVERDLRKTMTDSDIDPARVILAGRSKGSDEHFAHYLDVDLCLDSFPYNGTTTTCDSLFMGVPVLCCQGGSHISRVSASQLLTLGLDQLVTPDLTAYQERAVTLAREWDKLENLRQGLRQRMQDSAIMDHSGFTLQLEEVYTRIWQRWCKENSQ